MDYTPAKTSLNASRYRPDNHGHYESYFLRANHPTEAKAFWIRYTIFIPKDKSKESLGELWAIYFEQDKPIIAAKQEFPFTECQFNTSRLQVAIGDNFLRPGIASGRITKQVHAFQWDLSYQTQEKPILLVSEKYLTKSFPKAKVICANPHAVFSGEFTVNQQKIVIDNWVGSENHNWGSKHTDQYAWCQVVGFDNDKNAFLECATAKIRLGPIQTPWFTPVVLRVANEDYCFNGLWQSAKARGGFDFFSMHFDSCQNNIRIHGTVSARRENFVGLTYYNPPGGSHTCLNSKIAACKVTLERPGKPAVHLHTNHRAAFEIISPRQDHGVTIAV